jgi:hypothetical protein
MLKYIGDGFDVKDGEQDTKWRICLTCFKF